MHFRMSFLRLTYTCLFEASRYGKSCVEPTFFYYPDSEYFSQPNHTEDNFIFAGSLLVNPILQSLPTDATQY